MRKDARLSACGSYRYWLTREWDEGAWKLPFIMLNPSTADAEIDDPTIRRCMGFAKALKFGGIHVLNLFALRSTDPTALKKHPDPVGPENNAHLDVLFNRARLDGVPVVAAWGAHGALSNRDKQVIALAGEHGLALSCLGKTKEGHPRHPLYLRADATLELLPG
jgi:hypothetical protein